MDQPASHDLAFIAKSKLAEILHHVLDSELQRGNRICRIDEPAGTRCPLAIVFTLPLQKIDEHLDRRLRWAEIRDTHYEPVATGGYFCVKTRHYVYGPLTGRYPSFE